MKLKMLCLIVLFLPVMASANNQVLKIKRLQLEQELERRIDDYLYSVQKDKRAKAIEELARAILAIKAVEDIL